MPSRKFRDGAAKERITVIFCESYLPPAPGPPVWHCPTALAVWFCFDLSYVKRFLCGFASMSGCCVALPLSCLQLLLCGFASILCTALAVWKCPYPVYSGFCVALPVSCLQPYLPYYYVLLLYHDFLSLSRLLVLWLLLFSVAIALTIVKIVRYEVEAFAGFCFGQFEARSSCALSSNLVLTRGVRVRSVAGSVAAQQRTPGLHRANLRCPQRIPGHVCCDVGASASQDLSETGAPSPILTY